MVTNYSLCLQGAAVLNFSKWKFSLDVKKNFLTMRVVKHCLPRDCGISIFEGFLDQFRQAFVLDSFKVILPRTMIWTWTSWSPFQQSFPMIQSCLINVMNGFCLLEVCSLASITDEWGFGENASTCTHQFIKKSCIIFTINLFHHHLICVGRLHKRNWHKSYFTLLFWLM